ncbi:MAG TPA: hypothetical protein VI699_03230 [Candidatus Acidoferrales bacterium]|nr:hypothetical protein [Candidatus Acidoferrales bacterium]
MPRVTLEEAYPRIAFRRRTRNWWARLVGQPAECVHLETQHSWMALLAPDTLYLRGKGVPQREPLRPEVSLCLDCLIGVIESELAAYRGRVVAFEPHEETFSQYFFLAAPDFEAAGLMPEVAAAIEKRLAEPIGSCAECSAPARWLWLPRQQVPSLDDFEEIARRAGERLCARHGARRLCSALEEFNEANVFYINAPYGESGAYVWF